MLIGISSCATNRESVSQPASQPVVNPSELSEIPFKAGETVMIYTKSKITISSWDVSMVRMVITDVNAIRIIGKIDFVCCDYEYGKEDVVGEVVEVDIDNIAKIKLSEEQVQAVAKKTSGEKTAAGLAGELAFEIAGRVIGLAIFLVLFAAII